jgi:hypothetical protein
MIDRAEPVRQALGLIAGRRHSHARASVCKKGEPDHATSVSAEVAWSG